MEFKVGERIVVYSGAFGRAIATVKEASACQLKITCKELGHIVGLVHPKQCRKLKKKKRRRVWLNKHWVDGKDVGGDIIACHGPDPDIDGDMIEFAEVRRKR